MCFLMPQPLFGTFVMFQVHTDILAFLYCNKINSLPVSINKSDSLGLHCLINQLCVLVFCAVQYCHKFALPPVHKCIHFKNFQL